MPANAARIEEDLTPAGGRSADADLPYFPGGERERRIFKFMLYFTLGTGLFSLIVGLFLRIVGYEP